MSRHSTASSKWDRRERGAALKDKHEPTLEPFWISIKTTMRILDLSRSDIHRKIKARKLRAVKDGARTKIDYQSAKALATDPSSA